MVVVRLAAILLPVFAATKVSAAPTTAVKERATYPFSHLVAFGDNLSDNGNGSVAHGVAQEGDPSNLIYGFGTWTNGPVAVMYLAGSLGMPLLDYAFGHKYGGSLFGATVNNEYTQSTALAPSSRDQIANYSSSANVGSASSALHFLWIGANDINLYHCSFVPGSNNTQFAYDMSTRIANQVGILLNAGAPYVFVPGLYAKHLSPSYTYYTANARQQATMGQVIQQANAAIQSRLQAFGSRVIYYDVFSRMVNIYNNAATFGITHVTDWCDGFSDADFALCIYDSGGEMFYWTQHLDMTTYVHRLIADDMLTTINTHLGI